MDEVEEAFEVEDEHGYAIWDEIGSEYLSVDVLNFFNKVEMAAVEGVVSDLLPDRILFHHDGRALQIARARLSRSTISHGFF